VVLVSGPQRSRPDRSWCAWWTRLRSRRRGAGRTADADGLIMAAAPADYRPLIPRHSAARDRNSPSSWSRPRIF
jgi:hypothetical protein